ncbi:MAG: YggT family protein [Acidimicrobiales bacterium]
MQSFVLQVINLYVLVVFARIVLSWFPTAPGTALAGVNDFLRSLTEPLLAPLRRALPPMGMFDLSPMVLIFGLVILTQLVASA